MTFTDGGITSSLGQVGIVIARDRHGRISSITDPAGNAIVYGYSANGDLVRVVDREGQQTTMTYRTDLLHYLDTVIDPLGRTGLRHEYAADGRLVGTIDAQGLRRTFSFDLDDRIESSTDPLVTRWFMSMIRSEI